MYARVDAYMCIYTHTHLRNVHYVNAQPVGMCAYIMCVYTHTYAHIHTNVHLRYASDVMRV